jgi:hypothetical protein
MKVSSGSGYVTLLRALLNGIGAAADTYRSAKYPTAAGSDLDRMRGDVTRVGVDFNRVIERNIFDKPQP